MRQTIVRLILGIVLLAAALPVSSPAQAGDPPCTLRSDNMTRNGSVTNGGYSTQYGTVANEWNPFIYGGSPPAYNLADNESANGDVPGSSSQYIHGDGVQWDAGIYQTINGTQPGTYYQFSVGWAKMLRDIGGGQNRNIDNVIARRVGADPTGGTDPHSPNVIWGPEFWSGSAGINSPKMVLVFAAQADHVTVFVRAYDTSAAPSDKVFLDVMCLLPRTDMPTATPAVTATNTPAPTNPPRAPIVVQKAEPIRPTSVPTNTPTPPPTPTETPTITNTPLPTLTPTETPKPRRPIPIGAPTTSLAATMDIGGATTNVGGATASGDGNLLSVAVLVGSLGIIGFSLIGILALIAFLFWRIRRPSRTYVRFDDFYPPNDPRGGPNDRRRGDIY
jgi:hypothetical protein